MTDDSGRWLTPWDDPYPEKSENDEQTLYGYPKREYEYLPDIISFKNFDYSGASYINQEETILKPQLQRLGYSEIIWLKGESDSFGPLTRVCRAFDNDGELHWFYYG